MGLLDQVMGSMGARGPAQQKPGLGSTVAAGVVLALLVKGVRSYQRSHGQAPGEDRTFQPQAQQPQATGGGLAGGLAGGLGGVLGGLLGGGQGASSGAGGLGGLLGGLGGAGALGALVGQLQQRGLGPQVSSWVGHGQNQPVHPEQLANALGEENIQALQQQTGLPRESLLTELSEHLPEAVHDLTPQGRLPDEAELGEIAHQAQAPRG